MCAPLISVILPTYNREKYLKRAIDSVLSQDFEDFELLVIDDGSTDGTQKLLLEYEDARLRIFHQENKGVSSARNFGLRKARGKYITFVDSDDYLLNGFFKSASTQIKDLDIDVLLYGGFMQEKNTSIDVYHFWLNPQRYANKNSILKSSIFFENFCLYCGNSWACGKFFKRTTILNNQLHFSENLRYAEDMIFNMEFYLNAANVKLCNQRYYVCDVSTRSLSRGELKTTEVLQSLIHIDEKLCTKYPTLAKLIHQNTMIHSKRWLWGDFKKLTRKTSQEDFKLAELYSKISLDPQNLENRILKNIMQKKFPLKTKYILLYIMQALILPAATKLNALKNRFYLPSRLRRAASKIKRLLIRKP